MAAQTLSYQLLTKTFIPVKLLGTGTFGEAYLAIQRDAADELRAQSSELFADQTLAAKQWLYGQLRKHLVVVKISNALYEHTDRDLSNEIAMLTLLSDSPPGLIHAIDYEDQAPAQWLSMPYITGRDLSIFADNWYDELSVPFIWHVAHGLGSILLYLHYGVKDTSNAFGFDPEWNGLAHDDIHCGNLFLQPAAHGKVKKFGNFPNIILADFGRMKFACRKGMTVGTANPSHCHYRDLMNTGTVLYKLLEVLGPTSAPLRGCYNQHRDRLILTWVHRLRQPDLFDRKASHQELFGLLSEFVAMADHERRVGYKPLSSCAEGCLESDYTDDEELALLFDSGRMFAG
ncbi:hypothetical protein LTR78_009638 [Recurvomyces mirabilis]|uniref:Protein kinase domain-containing protein n=1 Tax=Recurvomyces mirabilis TaxID=574656 RepID=A0AAE0TPB0_9PEZI|nr:hypothetical protein LTR78_009638 [Recurvomyces mirabilis]KAK5152124.1 hypothetical protein LTS14_008499 [Recurvomyces mirabilis]